MKITSLSVPVCRIRQMLKAVVSPVIRFAFGNLVVTEKTLKEYISWAEDLDKDIRKVLKTFAKNEKRERFIPNAYITEPIECENGLSINGKMCLRPTEAAQTLVKALTIDEKRWAKAFQYPTGKHILDRGNKEFHLQHLWLKKGMINAGVHCTCIAIQEGRLISGRADGGNNTKCRRERHNLITRYLQEIIGKQFGLEIGSKSNPAPKAYNDYVTLYYDTPMVMTEAKLLHNRPDLVLFNKKRKTIHILEIAVSWPTVVKTQYNIKLNRYGLNSNTENVSVPPLPGPNLAGELGKIYGKDFARGVFVKPVVFGVTGELYQISIDGIEDAIDRKLSSLESLAIEDLCPNGAKHK
eukprot:gene24240-29083_t